MQRTMDETLRRRKIQEQYNQDHNITPQTICSRVKDSLNQHLADSGYLADDYQMGILQAAENLPVFSSIRDLEKEIKKLEKEMQTAAKELAFEQAAALRDRIKAMRKLEIEIA